MLVAGIDWDGGKQAENCSFPVHRKYIFPFPYHRELKTPFTENGEYPNPHSYKPQ
jgi:hypothetical protein